MPAPRLVDSPPLFVVLNVASGKGDAHEASHTIERVCRDAGRAVTLFTVDHPNQLRMLADEAVAGACSAQGVLVAAGGDGTINLVAQAALGKGCAFGVLPQGTFNYFSRNQGIPADTEEALKLLLVEKPRPVQVGLVNDKVFLVNASLGLYARMLEEREGFKRHLGRHRWTAFVAGLWTIFKGGRSLDLRFTWQDKTTTLRTPSLFVGNNALQLEQVGLADAEAPEHGQLAGVAVLADGLVDMVGLLARGVQGRLKHSPDIRSFAFTSVEVAPRRSGSRRRVKVAVDGEISRIAMPLTIRVAPDQLWLVRPETAPELEAARLRQAEHARPDGVDPDHRETPQ